MMARQPLFGPAYDRNQGQLMADPSYRLALEMQQHGADTSPVQSPWEGLARMLQAPIGALVASHREGRMDDRRKEGNERLADLMLGGGQPAAGIEGQADPRREKLLAAMEAGIIPPEALGAGVLKEFGLDPNEDQRNFQREMQERSQAFQRESQNEQRAFQRSMRAPPQRRIVQGPDGLPYYADNAEPVLPGVAGKGADAPTVRVVKQTDGSEVALQWSPKQEQWVPMDAPEGGLTPADQRRKLTENQSKLTLFQSNMGETAPLLNGLEKIYDPANFGDAAARAYAPKILENYLKSEEGQAYQTLARQWSEGALRIATGAATTQDEINRTNATYFAQPGDSPSTVHLKSQMRASYERAIKRSLGENAGGQIEWPATYAAKFAAKNVQQGMQPQQPQAGGIGGIVPEDVPPAGVDADVWQFMTPEEKALFK